MCGPSIRTCGRRRAGILLLTVLAVGATSLVRGVGRAQDPFEGEAGGAVVEETGKQLPSPAALRDLRTGAQHRALDRMRENVSLEFTERPLSQAIDDIARQTRLAMTLDSFALDEAGIDSSTPISFPNRDLPLESTLALALRQVGLTFLVRDGVVVVTTIEDAESRPMTQLFDLRALIPPEAPAEATAAIVDLLATSVAPDSWDAHGGTGTLAAYQGILVASNTYDVLRDMESLLEQFRRQLVASGGLQPWHKSGDSRKSWEGQEPQGAVRRVGGSLF